MEIIAYTDRYSVRPGERLDFMVSTDLPTYDVAIIHHDRFFDDPEPEKDTAVPSPVDGSYQGRHQAIPIGSHALVADAPALQLVGSFTVQTWICPGLTVHSHAQAIVAKGAGSERAGFALALDTDGRLTFGIGDGADWQGVTAPAALMRNRWYAVAARFDADAGTASLDWTMLRRVWLPEQGDRASASVALRPALSGSPLLIGAGALEPMRDGRPGPVDLFNGKIDRVRLWDRALSDAEVAAAFAWGDPAAIHGLVACWDPSLEISSTTLVDTGVNRLNATLVNQPMRGVVGANWDGSETTFRLKPEHYGAIAYHEDDLEDCGWSVDFTYGVPEDLPSGLYAARLTAGASVEYIPFYVRPRPGEETSVLYLAPTNTYLAYANERLFKGAGLDPEFLAKATDHQVVTHPREHWLDEHPELGSSVYDLHPDGTGVAYSTRLRPVVTMRPQFKLFINGCPRHFAADLFLIEWLRLKEIAFDVAIDEDVHREGRAAFAPYNVVITGSHPEYWTTPMMNALREYLADGGRVMYLGGNGFYWVTAIADDRPHLVEVRRGINGTRAWTSHPGEVYLSLTGEQGGLWRFRGLEPNRFVGIGFASEGWGGAEGYDRLPDSHDPRASWAFEGIGENEVIGDFGLIMDGASGDEIDRYDLANGTPPETLRLASSEGRHTDYYQIVIEDLTMTFPGHGGQEDPRVRADITLLEAPNGGAVFSTGSINWSGSLLSNGSDNNVSKLTENVLRKFMS